MKITSTLPGQSHRSRPRTESLPEFEPGVAPYFGPEDGLSSEPRHEKALGRAAKAVTSFFYRTEVEGKENLPESGANIYASNHSSLLDAAIVPQVPTQEVRTMATIDIFKSRVGAKFAELAGVFPVKREDPHEVSREHPKDVLNDDKGFLIFPEGTFPTEAAKGATGPFKKGVAAIAIDGEADTIVPLVHHYHPDTKSRPAERVKGALMAAGVTVGTAMAGMAGGPVLRAIGGAVAGAITGATLTGTKTGRKAENKLFWNPAPKMLSTVAGVVGGGIVGGIAGGLGVQSEQFGTAVALGLSGAAGLSTAALTSRWSARSVCTVRVGEHLDPKPYQEKAKLGPEQRREAITELTRDLHEHIGHIKADMSGIPYDPNAQRIRDGFPLVSSEEGLSLH